MPSAPAFTPGTASTVAARLAGIWGRWEANVEPGLNVSVPRTIASVEW